ncbi:hypothetical protein [Candidatus Odyssella thessalonicensis]|uniref:hypothetical protein n=1 Tax=Candidatus Odyssella thessalonicensis TaxID=84647 RepID=UPI000225ACED|nr:hypothetical protein [Candidatus Odyssella thessalonicensis]
MDLRLERLSIPAGWIVEWNVFYDMSPPFYNEAEPLWELFKEDMLYIKHKNIPYSVDLGWSPENSPAGNFVLRLLKDENWKTPVLEVTSPNKDEIVEKLNELILAVSNGEIR